jgi:hypothetical protein
MATITIKQIKQRYPFLDDVKIHFLNCYGETAFRAGDGSIEIYVESMKEFVKTKRFARRFGRANWLRSLLMVLLHEIHHVYQHKTTDPIVLLQEIKAINDSERHDDSWIEKDADEFARKEIKSFKNLTKLKL